VTTSDDETKLSLLGMLAPPVTEPVTESEIARELVRQGLEWAIGHVTTVLPTLHEVAGVLGDDEKPDDQLMLVMQLLHHAELQLPEMLGRVVALAVIRGASWSSVAESLECTRQGAQKRFSPVVTLLAANNNADTVSHPTGARMRR
jgi:hypothetical protein